MTDEATIAQMQRWVDEHPDIVALLEMWARIAPVYEDARRVYEESVRAMNPVQVVTVTSITVV